MLNKAAQARGITVPCQATGRFHCCKKASYTIRTTRAPMHPVSAVAAIAAITIALTAAAYPHPAAAAATAAKSAAAPPPAFRFAATYGDHMVLKSAPAAAVIWGFGTAGSSVTVTSTAGAGFTATVAADSTWIGKLAPTESKDANTGDMVTAAVTATQGSDSINITDVLFGEVWVCEYARAALPLCSSHDWRGSRA